MNMTHIKLVCPYCRTELKENTGNLQCLNCRRTFPIVECIPNFLPEEIAPKRKRLLDFVERISSIYETSLWYPVVYHLYGGLFIPSVKEEINMITDMLGVEGGTALDVACGTGMFTRRIAQGTGQCYGIDMSMGMLEKAVKYAEKNRLSNITFIRSEVEHMPFPDHAFDGVACCGALHLFPDVKGALREMNRVLKKNGKLVVMTFIRRRFLSIKGVHEHLEKEHGTHIFEVDELQHLLESEKYTEFKSHIFGSLILFEARKKE